MTIIEYWNLIDQETFLAITWDTDFSRAWSFCRMLMNHKNFHFTQIPDKNNNVIFLKSPKTMLLGHFWTFLVISAQWGFFPKNPAVTNNYIWAPNTMLVSEKTHEPIPRKPMDRRQDGQKDRRTDRPYFIGPLRPRPGLQKDGMRNASRLTFCVRKIMMS